MVQEEPLANTAPAGRPRWHGGLAALMLLAAVAFAAQWFRKPPGQVPPETVPGRDPTAARQYAEGIERLRRLDAVGARDLLAAAVEAEPGNALWQAALAEAWALLGYNAKAAAVSEVAFERRAGLPAPERLMIEGRYHESRQDWQQAMEIYQGLFRAGHLDYGLWLVRVQVSGGEYAAALATVEKLRRLPAPASENPRIDLREAEAQLYLGEARASRALAERALSKGRAAGARFVMAHARIAEALALQDQGDATSKAVMTALDEAREIFAAGGVRQGVARALDLAAWSTYVRGDLKGAERSWAEALVIYREIGLQDNIAGVLMSKGNLASDQGRFDEGDELYEECMDIFRQLGNVQGIAEATLNLGFNSELRGDLGKALSGYRQALTLYEELGDAASSAIARGNIATVYTLRGDLERAREIYDEVLAFRREIDDSPQIAYIMFQLGKIFATDGDLLVTRERFQGALVAQRRIGQVLSVAKTRLALAELVLAQGDPVLAERLALEAEEVLLIEGAVNLAGLADTLLVRALLAQGKLQAARAINVQARQLAAGSDDLRLRFAATIVGARVRATAGGQEIAAALAELESVRLEASEAGLMSSAFEARLAAGEIEAASGATAAARARLSALAQEARDRGFGQISRLAAAASPDPARL